MELFRRCNRDSQPPRTGTLQRQRTLYSQELQTGGWGGGGFGGFLFWVFDVYFWWFVCGLIVVVGIFHED